MATDRSKCAQWSNHVPDGVERDRLVATLGAALRSMRLAYDVGTRPLARRSTVARSTIQRLEAGQRRPRRSVLAALAYGLDPGRADQLAAALCDAAGDSLREDTAGGLRRRERRRVDARRAVGREVWRVWRDAEQAKHERFALLVVTLRKLPLDPAAERERLMSQFDAHRAVLDRARQLDTYEDALHRALSRPRHPLEVNILDWHTARRRARGGA